MTVWGTVKWHHCTRCLTLCLFALCLEWQPGGNPGISGIEFVSGTVLLPGKKLMEPKIRFVL